VDGRGRRDQRPRGYYLNIFDLTLFGQNTVGQPARPAEWYAHSVADSDHSLSVLPAAPKMGVRLIQK
jgi:hypothetical protein